MGKEEEIFVSPTKGEMGIERMVAEMLDFMKAEPENEYLVAIGSDSQVKSSNGHQRIDFVTAVVVHRVGRGAIFFLKKEKQDRVPGLREKIISETLKSVNTALEITSLIEFEKNPVNFSMEIHIDVGENGPTKELIKEAVGMVNGNGFPAKIKPKSPAASSVADREAHRTVLQ
jgi:predicted RNase H-related nuclease YkuK (DUF458 family)